ncbi:nucleotide-binding alpha-beta plait domain-containing protein, partial [Tanacetum coccineum]
IWAEGKITVSERSEVSHQHDTRIFDQDTMKSTVSWKTTVSKCYDYFIGTLRAEVTEIVLNSWENGYYNKSCLVTFSTRKDAKRTCDHHIGGVKVTVKRYRGKEEHPEVFQIGEHDLFIKGTNLVSILHRLFEDICVRCGPESGINFLRSEEDGLYNGEVVITFYNVPRQMALDIVTGEYNLEAYLLKSADQPAVTLLCNWSFTKTIESEILTRTTGLLTSARKFSLARLLMVCLDPYVLLCLPNLIAWSLVLPGESGTRRYMYASWSQNDEWMFECTSFGFLNR